MKRFAAAAIAAAALAPAAQAQTRVMQDHAQTSSALQCLLDHVQDKCPQRFSGSARRPAQFWLWWNANKDFELGRLVSSHYAGTEAVNAYLTKLLSGRPADVYDVQFSHHRKTFYIVPPGADGTIVYMLIRDGAPDDEKTDLFVRGPG